MTRDEIIERLQKNLTAANIEAESIRVQQGSYGGWTIAVVADEFDNLPPALRRKEILEGLDEIGIEWTDLMTPAELEWSGGLPSEESEDRLPLWPEALARGMTSPELMRFPSDEDEDLEPPLVVTFYSLRGGVGRSTALAHTARLLAAERKKVLCVDMDLEAPGLAALFGCENEVGSLGVVRLLLDLDQGDDPDAAKHLIRITEEHDLYLLPAGQVDPNYARQVRFLDPNAWYREERNPLRAFMHKLRTGLPFIPDIILVDARTGITPMSGPMLFELADIAIVNFFPHPQARRGTELLVRGLLSSKTYRDTHPGFTPEIRFIASPIPAVRETLEKYERRTLEWVAEWLSEANDARGDNEYIDERDITVIVPYREEIAASDSVSDANGIERMFVGLRDWMLRFLPSPREQRTEASLENLKPEVLNELSFSAGTAEIQTDFLDNFVQTEVIRDAIKRNIPLVLGRKGSGKTAIFRWLLESEAVRSIGVHAPMALKGDRLWILSADGFREVETVAKKSILDWRTFWALYICTAVCNSLENLPQNPDFFSGISLNSEIGILDASERVGTAKRGALELANWLQRLDKGIEDETILLFDGLDTGFGNTVEDRLRRREAIEGLFSLWMDRGQGLSRLRFKVLLREDIWRQLRFENKSHMYGRSVLLKWPDQATYFKVALKQAMRAESYQRVLKARPGGERLISGSVDNWSSDDVWEAWTALVGERMKGGKTAFTRNWVWNRLADANDDHAPRYLLQLFHEAIPWEQQQHQLTPYERSVIRPRGLVQCLSAVSEQALIALREEFSELEPLLDVLRRIARSPLSAEDLGQLDQEIALAREVGLLDIYEEKEDEVQRYKVPDIYRLALGMTRKGQA